MQVSFDIDEFIAYLLNGSLLLITLIWVFGAPPDWVWLKLPSEFQSAVVFGNVIVFGALALLAGHISSVFSRKIGREIIWRATGSPRLQPFVIEEDPVTVTEASTTSPTQNVVTQETGVGPRSSVQDQILTLTFWNGPLKQQVRDHSTELFPNCDFDGPHTPAPRLIRTYCLLRCPELVRIRERIVRSRSMCGNAVLPFIIAIIACILNGLWIMVILLTLGLVALVTKQHDLDQREWKEIYGAFICLNSSAEPGGQ